MREIGARTTDSRPGAVPAIGLLLALLCPGPVAAQEAPAVDPAPAIELPAGSSPIAQYAFTRAVERMSAGAPQEAVDLLTLAVELEPRIALYREALGDAYLALGAEEAMLLARREYETALDLEPGRARALEGIAQAALLTGRLGEAIDALERLAFAGGELEARYLPDLVALYLTADEAERGVAALEPHVRSGEAPLPVVLNLATLHRYLDEFDAALALTARVAGDADASEAERDLATRLDEQWRGEREAAGVEVR